MIAAHLNDAFWKRDWCEGAIVRRTRQLFSEVRRWQDLTYSEESLFVTEMTGEDLERRCEWLRQYPGPIITTLCLQGPKANYPLWPLRYADHVLAMCPQNFKGLRNLRGRWYKLFPDFQLEVGAQREYDVVYVGRTDTRKKLAWVAETFQRYPRHYAIVNARGLSGMKLYKFGRPETNPPRERIQWLLNRAHFALCYTTDGVGDYDSLENVMLEALQCGCAPVLHRDWCSTYYRGYPLQVGSIQEARDLFLTPPDRFMALHFMSERGEPGNSCRTAPELRALLEATAQLPYRREERGCE